MGGFVGLRLASRRPELVEVWRRRVAGQNRFGITRAVVGVVEREGMAEELDRVRVPTLVLVGEEDTATTPEKAERLRQGITGSELVVIPRAGHMSTLENPEAVTRAIESFLGRVGSAQARSSPH